MDSPSTQAMRARRSLGLHSSLFGAHQETISSPAGSKHTIEIEELITISKFVNGCLGGDPQLADKLPIHCDFNSSEDLFEKMKDGIILIKLINLVKEGTISMAKVSFNSTNQWKIIGNLNLVMEGAHKLGVKAINIGAQDIASGSKTAILSLVWQLVRLFLFSKITLNHCPGLKCLLQHGESVDNPPITEEVLLRWMRHHLLKAGVEMRERSFAEMKDPRIFCILLNELDRNVCDVPPVSATKLYCADKAVTAAEALGALSIVEREDLCNKNPTVTMLFCATIFNACHGLSDNVEENEGFDTLKSSVEDLMSGLEGLLGQSDEEEAQYWEKFNQVDYDDLMLNIAEVIPALSEALGSSCEEIYRLKDRLRQNEAVMLEYSATVPTLNEALISSSSQIQVLKSSIVSIETKTTAALSSRDSTIAQVQNQIAKMEVIDSLNRCEIQKLIKENENLKLDTLEKECKIAALCGEKLAAQAENVELVELLQASQASVEALMLETNLYRERANQESTALREILLARDEQIRVLQAELIAHETNIERMERDGLVLRTMLAAQCASVTELTNFNEELKSSLIASLTRIRDLEQSLAASKLEIQELSMAQGRATILEGMLADAEARIDGCRGEIGALRISLESREADLVEARRYGAEQFDILRLCRGDMTSLQRELDLLRGQHEQTTEGLLAKTDECAAQAKQIVELQHNLAATEEALRNHALTEANLRTVLDVKCDAIVKLIRSLEELKSALQAATRHMCSLEKEGRDSVEQYRLAVVNLQSMLTSKDEEINARKHSLSIQRQNHQSQLVATNEIHGNLTLQITRLQEIINDHLQSNAQFTNAIRCLEVELSEMKAMQSELQVVLSRKDDENIQLQEQNSHLQASMGMLEAQKLEETTTLRLRIDKLMLEGQALKELLNSRSSLVAGCLEQQKSLERGLMAAINCLAESNVALHVSQERSNELDSLVRQLSSDERVLRAECDTRNADISNLISQITALQRTSAFMEEELNDTKAAQDNLQLVLSHKNSENVQMLDQNSQLQASMAMLEAQKLEELSALRLRIDELMLEGQALKELFNSKSSLLASSLAQEVSLGSCLMATMNYLAEFHAKSSSAVAEMRTALDVTEERSTELDGLVRQLSLDEKFLRAQLDARNSDIANVTSQIATLRHSSACMEAELNDVKASNDDLQVVLSRKNDIIAQLSEQNGHLQMSIGVLEAQKLEESTALQLRIEALIMEGRRLKEVLGSRNSLVANCLAEVDSLRSSLMATVNHLAENCAESSSTVAELRTALHTSGERSNELDALVRQMSVNESTLRAEIVAKNRDVDELTLQERKLQEVVNEQLQSSEQFAHTISCLEAELGAINSMQGELQLILSHKDDEIVQLHGLLGVIEAEKLEQATALYLRIEGLMAERRTLEQLLDSRNSLIVSYATQVESLGSGLMATMNCLADSDVKNNSTIAELRTAFHLSEERTKELDSLVREMKEDLDARQDNIEHLTSQNTKLQNVIDEYLQSNGQFTHAIKRMAAELDEVKTTRDELQLAVTRKDSEMVELQNQISQLHGSISALKAEQLEQSASLHRRIEALKELLNSRASLVASFAAQAEFLRTNLIATVNCLTESNVQSTCTITEMKTALQESCERSDELSALVRQLSLNEKLLRAEVDARNVEIQNLQQTVAQLKADGRVLHQLLEVKNRTLCECLNVQHHNNIYFEKVLHDIEVQKSNDEQVIADLKRSIGVQATSLTALEFEIEARQSTIVALESQAAIEMESFHERVNAHSKVLELMRCELAAQIQLGLESNESNTREREVLQAKLNDLQKSVSNLRVQLIEKDKSLADAMVTVGLLEDKLAVKTHTLAQCLCLENQLKSALSSSVRQLNVLWDSNDAEKIDHAHLRRSLQVSEDCVIQLKQDLFVEVSKRQEALASIESLKATISELKAEVSELEKHRIQYDLNFERTQLQHQHEISGVTAALEESSKMVMKLRQILTARSDLIAELTSVCEETKTGLTRSANRICQLELDIVQARATARSQLTDAKAALNSSEEKVEELERFLEVRMHDSITQSQLLGQSNHRLTESIAALEEQRNCNEEALRTISLLHAEISRVQLQNTHLNTVVVAKSRECDVLSGSLSALSSDMAALRIELQEDQARNAQLESYNELLGLTLSSRNLLVAELLSVQRLLQASLQSCTGQYFELKCQDAEAQRICSQSENDLRLLIVRKDADLESLQSTIRHFERTIETISRENASHKELIAVQCEDMAAMTAKFIAKGREYDELVSLNGRLAETAALLQAKLRELLVSLNDKTSECNLLDQMNAALLREMEELKSRDRDLESQLIVFLDQANQHVQQCTSLQQHSIVLETELGDSKVMISDQSALITSLRDKVATLETNESALRQDLRSREVLSARVSNELETLTASFYELKEQCAELQKLRSTSQMELALMSHDSASKSSMLKCYASAMQTVQCALQETCIRVSTADVTISRLSEENAVVVQTVVAYNNGLTSAMSDIAALNAHCVALQQENDSLRRANADFLKEHNDHDTLVSKLSASLQTSMHSVESLLAKESIVDNELRQQKETNAMLQATISAQAEVIAAAEQQIVSLQDHTTELLLSAAATQEQIQIFQARNGELEADSRQQQEQLRQLENTHRGRSTSDHDDLLVLFHWDNDDVLRLRDTERSLFHLLVKIASGLQRYLGLLIPEQSTASRTVLLSSTSLQLLFGLFSKIGDMASLFESYCVPNKREVSITADGMRENNKTDEAIFAQLLTKLWQEINIKCKSRMHSVPGVGGAEVMPLLPLMTAPASMCHSAPTIKRGSMVNEAIQCVDLQTRISSSRRFRNNNANFRLKSEKVHYDVMNDSTLLDDILDEPIMVATTNKPPVISSSTQSDDHSDSNNNNSADMQTPASARVVNGLLNGSTSKSPSKSVGTYYSGLGGAGGIGHIGGLGSAVRVTPLKNKVNESPSKITRPSSHKALIGQGTTIVIHQTPAKSKKQQEEPDVKMNEAKAAGGGAPAAEAFPTETSKAPAPTSYRWLIIMLVIFIAVGAAASFVVWVPESQSRRIGQSLTDLALNMDNELSIKVMDSLRVALASVQELKQQNDQLDAENEELLDRIDESRKELEGKEYLVSTLCSTVQTSLISVQNLKEDNDESERQVNVMTEECERAARELKDQKMLNSTLLESVQVSLQSVQTLRLDNTALQETVDAQIIELSEKQQLNESLCESLQNCMKSICELKSDNAELQDKLDAAFADADELREKLKQAESLNGTLCASVQNSLDSIVILKADNSRLVEELDQVENVKRVQELEEELKAAYASLRNNEMLTNTLSIGLRDSLAAVQELKKENSELSEEIDSILSERESLQSELDQRTHDNVDKQYSSSSAAIEAAFTVQQQQQQQHQQQQHSDAALSALKQEIIRLEAKVREANEASACFELKLEHQRRSYDGHLESLLTSNNELRSLNSKLTHNLHHLGVVSAEYNSDQFEYSNGHAKGRGGIEALGNYILRWQPKIAAALKRLVISANALDAYFHYSGTADEIRNWSNVSYPVEVSGTCIRVMTEAIISTISSLESTLAQLSDTEHDFGISSSYNTPTNHNTPLVVETLRLETDAARREKEKFLNSTSRWSAANGSGRRTPNGHAHGHKLFDEQSSSSIGMPMSTPSSALNSPSFANRSSIPVPNFQPISLTHRNNQNYNFPNMDHHNGFGDRGSRSGSPVVGARRKGGSPSPVIPRNFSNSTLNRNNNSHHNSGSNNTAQDGDMQASSSKPTSSAASSSSAAAVAAAPAEPLFLYVLIFFLCGCVVMLGALWLQTPVPIIHG